MCLGFARHLDAPVEGRARDRQILQAAADKTRDFVHALARQHEIGHALIEIEQPLGESGELEEIALLLDPFDRRALRTEPLRPCRRGGFRSRRNRPRRAPNTSRNICRDRYRRPPPCAARSPPRNGDGALGGADEFVVGAIEPLHHGLEARHVALDQFARRHVLLGRGLQHLDAVLVGAGEEEHVAAIEPHEAGNGVGGDGS